MVVVEWFGQDGYDVVSWLCSVITAQFDKIKVARRAIVFQEIRNIYFYCIARTTAPTTAATTTRHTTTPPPLPVAALTSSRGP
jgi:hypothetical protein